MASGVTTKTLYNLFGSKGALIYETIRYTSRSIMTSIAANNPDLDAFGRLVAYVTSAAKFNIAEPMYVAAAVYAYYSADSSSVAVRRDFREFVGPSVSRLLAEMQEAGELHQWSPIDIVARQIMDFMMSTAAEWNKEVISDKELLDASLLAVLSLMHVHITARREPELVGLMKSLSRRRGADANRRRS